MKRLLLPGLISAILAPAAHALIDTNGNGMSDIWEKLHNNNQLFAPTNPAHAPGADPDGDGWTNLQESVAGTNPFDSNAPHGRIGIAIAQIPAVYEPQDADSLPPPENPPEDPFSNPAPAVASPPLILLDPAQNTLTWPTVAGKIYRVDCSADLGAGSWIPASGWFHAEGIPLSYATETLHGDGTHPDKLFWRIAVADTNSDTNDLTDWEEHQLGTDPHHPDTDRDGIPDHLDPAPLVNFHQAVWDADAVDPANSPLFAAFNFTPQMVGSTPSPTRVLDISGNIRHATARNAAKNPPSPSLPALDNAEGISGDGFHSRGHNHFSFDPQSPAINFTPVRSLSFWCRTDLAAIAAGPQPIFSYIPNGAARGNQANSLNSYAIRAFLAKAPTGNGHEITFRSWENSGEIRERWSLGTNPRDLDGKWVNITFVWQGMGSGQDQLWGLYVNGVKQQRLIGSQKSFLNTPGGPQETFIIGADTGSDNPAKASASSPAARTPTTPWSVTSSASSPQADDSRASGSTSNPSTSTTAPTRLSM